MKRIILTGGIASGKSTVVKMLKEQNINIIDADEVSHDVNQAIYQESIFHPSSVSLC